MAKRQLVIIPGIGDRRLSYTLYAALWKLKGYEPYVYIFGWRDQSKTYTTKLNNLLSWLDKLELSNINVIGVSAGGAVGANMLMKRPELIHRVVTISTPYISVSSLKNHLLDRSIKQMRSQLKLLDSKTKKKLMSVYGIYDETVPTQASKFAGIRTLRIPAMGHGPIILFSLTIFSGQLTAFFECD